VRDDRDPAEWDAEIEAEFQRVVKRTDSGTSDPLALKVKKNNKRERIEGDFYQVSMAWADKASKVTGRYFLLALRVYRHWRVRKRGTDVVAITSEAIAGPGYSRNGKQRVVLMLERAGLIEVVERAPGRAPRVRVIDPQLVV
jgi:hypothetical protein